MTAPSLIHAARRAPDHRERILQLAEVLRYHECGPEGACTVAHARVGFTNAEIETYWDPAIGVLSGKPTPLRTTPPGRITALGMAARARSIRQRRERRAQLTNGMPGGSA